MLLNTPLFILETCFWTFCADQKVLLTYSPIHPLRFCADIVFQAINALSSSPGQFPFGVSSSIIKPPIKNSREQQFWLNSSLNYFNCNWSSHISNAFLQYTHFAGCGNKWLGVSWTSAVPSLWSCSDGQNREKALPHCVSQGAWGIFSWEPRWASYRLNGHRRASWWVSTPA